METDLGRVSLLAACIVMGLPACAIVPDIVQNKISQPISDHDARRQLKELKGRSLGTSTNLGSTQYDIKKVVVGAESLRMWGDNNRQWRANFATLPPVAISYATLPPAPAFLVIGDWNIFTGYGGEGNDVAKKYANALLVLKQGASAEAKTRVEVEFEKVVKTYRAASSRPELPEEANKYKVQAEGAVRDKAFDDAADLYAAALKIAPWWPVGHFNRALVLGETGDYGDAKREMKYYLQLVPDAPNARAAQDKIYEWERLESK